MHCLVSGTCCLFALILLTTAAWAQPKRLALVVGVRDYPVSGKLPDLTHTEADANLLAGTLTKSGYQVTLMTSTAAQGPGNGRFLPGAALIRARFEALVKTPFLKPTDCIVVTLAGHGIQLPSKDDAENKTYYFCPSDAGIDQLKFSEEVGPQHNLIPIQELYDTLEKSGAGVKLLAVDACRNDPNKPPLARAANSVTRPPVPVPPGGIAAYFSCSADEESLEDPILKHGVFTYYLNEALSGRGDTNSDQKITLAEIKEYVGQNVYNFVETKYGRSQLPEMEDKTRGFAPLIEIPRIMIPIGTKAGEVRTIGGIKFCWCPSGKFTMGSPVSELAHLFNETQADVTISKGYWLGQYEVTQAEWEKVMGTTISQQAERSTSSKTLAGTGISHPMYFVNWEEAMEFCRKLTSQEREAGRLPADWEYTLPTEAQWEYACRAGTTTALAFGDKLDSTQANFDGAFPYNGPAKGQNPGETVPVGSYQANAWNLCDMHGNVGEWCQDFYISKLPGGPDPNVQEEATLRTVRIYRGGNWYDYGKNCRSAFRSASNPDSRLSGVGFRVAAVPTR